MSYQKLQPYNSYYLVHLVGRIFIMFEAISLIKAFVGTKIAKVTFKAISILSLIKVLIINDLPIEVGPE